MATMVQLPSGRWRCVIRKRGIYESRTFESKTLAKKYATAREAVIDERAIGLVTPKAVTVRDLLQSYMKEVNIRSRTTFQTYQRIAASPLGAVRIRDLSHVHIDRYVADVMSNATAETCRIYLSLLNKAGRWARAVKHIDFPDTLCKDAIQRIRFNGQGAKSG